MNKNKKLSIKDLVTIGVFAVIYFVLMFVVGMIGFVPILYMIYPLVLGIVSGTVIMLFMAKVQKPWALFILGIISPLIFFFSGQTYVVAIHGLVIMLLAELIRRRGDYRSFKYNALSFAVFNNWVCGAFLQILILKDQAMEPYRVMGEDFVQALDRLITLPNVALVYLGGIVGGLIGAYIGRALLKKHFQKAGII